MVYGFNLIIIIKAAIDIILDRSIPLIIYTNSKSLYNSLVSLNIIIEKRLFINLRVLYELYECREFVDVFWIPALQNPADGMMKPFIKINRALNRLITTNRLELTPNAWVNQDNNIPQITPQKPLQL